jgi:hypothetical protein
MMPVAHGAPSVIRLSHSVASAAGVNLSRSEDAVTSRFNVTLGLKVTV